MSVTTQNELKNALIPPSLSPQNVIADTKERHQEALDDAAAKGIEYDAAKFIEINFFEQVKYFEAQFKSNPHDKTTKSRWDRARSLFSNAQIDTDVLRFSYQSRLSYASKLGQSAFLANAILGNMT